MKEKNESYKNVASLYGSKGLSRNHLNNILAPAWWQEIGESA